MNSTDLTPDTIFAHLELVWWLKVPMVIYLFTIHFFGVASNIVVAIIYGRTSPKTACDWLILTMSITDAFVCFCSPILYIRSYLRIPLPWKTSILCTFEYWLQLTAMFASCLLLAIIALDRYVKICRPGLTSLTPMMARNVCAITVLISAVVCLTPFLSQMMDFHCYISEIRKTGVTKVFFTSMFCCFVVSFCIVTFAYTSICKKISQKIKLKQRLIENKGLHLSVEQDQKRESNTPLPHCFNWWPQIFSSWSAKRKIKLRPPNKNEIPSKSSSDSLYSNGNIKRNGKSKDTNDKVNGVDDNEKAAFLKADLKINISTTEIMQCVQRNNLSENTSARLLIDEGEKTPNQHYTAAGKYTYQDVFADSDKITRLECETAQVLENGEINDGIILQKYDGEAVIRTHTAQNNDVMLLPRLKTEHNAVDNVDSRPQLAANRLQDHGVNSVTATYSREPVMNNYVRSSRDSANINWNSIPRVSVSDSNLLHTKRYLRRKVVRNYADHPHRIHKSLTMYSFNINMGDNFLLKHKGSKYISPKYSSFCHLIRKSLCNANTVDIKNTNSDPKIHITSCGEADARLWFIRNDSSHHSLIKTNSLVENDASKVSLAHNCNLPCENKLSDKMGHVDSRLSSSCTSCFQNPSEVFVNLDVCPLHRLATHNHYTQLVKSDPCLSLRLINGNWITSGGYHAGALSQMEIPGPTTDAECQMEIPGPTTDTEYQIGILGPNTDVECAFITNGSANEDSFILQELPRQRPPSNVTVSVNLKDHPSDFLQKSASSDRIQSALEQFESGSSIVAQTETPNPADEIEEEQDDLENTNPASARLYRPQIPTALKPTGSTSSRRSNRSSRFADPVVAILVVDNTYADDNDDVFSDVSTSPSSFACRKPRMKGACRRSRSSVRSTSSSKMRFARERQMTFMLLSVTAAFLLSWVPPWAMYMTSLYGPMQYSKSSVIQYLGTIHLLNYVASPIIYFTFNPTFRAKVSQLLTTAWKRYCCCGKKSSLLESPDVNSSRI